MGMFGKTFAAGGAGRNIAGYVGDALQALAGGKPTYGPMVQQRQQNAAEMQQAMQLARYKATLPEQDPSVIRTLRAAGIDPMSRQGKDIITNNLNRPFIVGSTEGGFTPVGGSFGMPGSSPPAAAGMASITDDAAGEAAYHALPSGTQFRDPQGNIRTKP